ncbi:MAG: quinate 5-dehydrogenase [Firmicutes bacterium]|nr:quinate 5-dehydrogenase [Bacillota bacterium]
MKRVVSVSIGSDIRNHRAEVELLGQRFIVERIGTNGDMQLAEKLISELDGQVAAFGLGGIDMYIWAGKRRYTIRDSKQLSSAAKHTPIVDGSGLKNTLEREVISFIKTRLGLELKHKRVLLVAAVDRFGMAEALAESDCDLVIGDLMFALGLPIPLRSLNALNIVARVAAPIAVRLPFHMLYPTGSNQHQEEPKTKFARYYEWADVIAGDYHFIASHMPANMQGKTVLTNTVTEDDVAKMRERGVETLITSTPNLGGRSFGTNVVEAILVALLEKPITQITPYDYLDMLKMIDFQPRVEYLQSAAAQEVNGKHQYI